MAFEHLRPQTRKAFAEEALALASLAQSAGFDEDARAMRKLAIKLDGAGIRASLKRDLAVAS